MVEQRGWDYDFRKETFLSAMAAEQSRKHFWKMWMCKDKTKENDTGSYERDWWRV